MTAENISNWLLQFKLSGGSAQITGLVLAGLYLAVLAWLANFATSLLAARLSRSDEYEADEYAAALMTKAGFGVTPQIELFHKLETLTGAVAGRPPAWLLSHPKTEERIAAIRALESRWQDA